MWAKWFKEYGVEKNSLANRRRAFDRRGLTFAKAVALLVLLMIAGIGAAAQKQEKYDQIEQQARAAQDGKRSELLADLAYLDFDRARGSYDAGKPEMAVRQLADARGHGKQAMDQLNEEAKRRKTHGMKHVEIEFRKIAFGLRDLSRSVSFEERPPVQDALQFFSDARSQILQMMFGGKV
jgi:hypothetical protein